MLSITDRAKYALDSVFTSGEAEGRNLVIYFAGHGWGGPSLGMALEESIDGLEVLESNGVTAYVETTLKKYLQGQGYIQIDHVSQSADGGGYVVTVGLSQSCNSGSSACT